MSIRAGRAEPGRRALVGGMIALTNRFHRTVNACLTRGSGREDWPGFRASGDRREVPGPSADRIRGSGTGIGRAGRGATPLLLLAISLLAPPTLATGAPADDDQPPAAARTDAISATDPRWLKQLPPLTLPLPKLAASADGDRAATPIAPVGMTIDPVAEAAAPKTAPPATEPEPAPLVPDPAPASPSPSASDPAAVAAAAPEPAPLAPDPTPASPAPSEQPQVAATPETHEPPAAIDPSAAADPDESLESEAASSIEVIDSLVFAGTAPEVASAAATEARIDPDASDPNAGASDPTPAIPSPTAAARHTSSGSSTAAIASDLASPGTDVSNTSATPNQAEGLASRYRWHVQILAGRSLELVKRDRDRFALRQARLLEGLTLTISRSKNTRRGGFYRLRATEWTSRQAAMDWCARLSARGQDCLVIRVTP